MDIVASGFDKVGLLKMADKCLLLFYEKCAAEVVFARRSDAFQAHKMYNNVQLDGKPIKIEIAGFNPLSARVNVVGGAKWRRTVVMAQRGRGGFRNAAVRGCGRGPGRVGRGNNKGAEKSAEELDKELDSYHVSAEAMPT
uniref:THO complex subunit 4C n=1 Tax=Nicotiana tabacum TaxID=4097 RepID=A0A1S4CDS9_TOBAC|nr:PREDICTED: THO complex subunit 4C-like [Nicotiana tabacum]